MLMSLGVDIFLFILLISSSVEFNSGNFLEGRGIIFWIMSSPQFSLLLLSWILISWMLEISLVDSLFSSCPGEFLFSVFIVLLFTNLFLFAEFSLFMPSCSHCTIVLLHGDSSSSPWQHLRVCLWRWLCGPWPMLPSSPLSSVSPVGGQLDMSGGHWFPWT